MPDHFKACARCGQTVITRSDTPMCATCAAVAREPQGEAVRLFEPAPAQMPGQTWLDRIGTTGCPIPCGAARAGRMCDH